MLVRLVKVGSILLVLIFTVHLIKHLTTGSYLVIHQNDQTTNIVKQTSHILIRENQDNKEETLDTSLQHPKVTEAQNQKPKEKPLILLYSGYYSSPKWWFSMDENDFRNCPNQCRVETDKNIIHKADMLLFESMRQKVESKVNTSLFLKFWNNDSRVIAWPSERPANQVWVFYSRESQVRGISGDEMSFARYSFNYTITFQKHAALYNPYGHTKRRKATRLVARNYAAGRRKLILWYVSNCNSKIRMRYTNELRRFIPVDMFGRCNSTVGDPCKKDKKCVKAMFTQYKFYLAFENSLCQDYITEKFWKTLNSGMVPIVMGAPRKDYERVAPPNSFIHVNDFETPEKLAEYLKYLDQHDDSYNQHHQWRQNYTIGTGGGSESPTCGICRLATEKPQNIVDITLSWNAATQCTKS